MLELLFSAIEAMVELVLLVRGGGCCFLVCSCVKLSGQTRLFTWSLYLKVLGDLVEIENTDRNFSCSLGLAACPYSGLGPSPVWPHPPTVPRLLSGAAARRPALPWDLWAAAWTACSTEGLSPALLLHRPHRLELALLVHGAQRPPCSPHHQNLPT